MAKEGIRVTTDITEDVIRNLALRNALVDIKVCAVDEIWPGIIKEFFVCDV